MLAIHALTYLAEPEWRARRAAHEARMQTWLGPHQTRAARGEKHPIYDFLFSYYAFRPAWLRRWHPGPDVVLAGESATEFLRWPEYQATSGGVALDPATLPPHRRPFVTWLRGLLTTMRDRPPFFACFGLHEWAMVYRQTPDEIRHQAWPLRFSRDELARLVEAQPLCCTHFDAFRFFTPAARPLNRLQPARETMMEHEQRGCLHANMDLYKWAFKLAPFTSSALLADCFELARDIREVDMRASPYDLRALGFEPIPIETAAGRTDYERHQRALATRGEPLRARLIALCERLLA
ncbi:MAG: 3-methyladenine DNA glycosylase [Opitutaceae bacterium]